MSETEQLRKALRQISELPLDEQAAATMRFLAKEALKQTEQK